VVVLVAGLPSVFFESDELLVSAGADPSVLVDSEVLLVVPSELLEGFDEEYRSEYQPPPFRMKFVPPLINRWAADFVQLGQISTGASMIR
jgi:hypothetical protein